MHNSKNIFESNKKNDTSQTIYYHYTSLDALYAIISNRSVRMTNMNFTNDRRELSYKVSEFYKDLKHLYENEKSIAVKKCLRLYIDSFEKDFETFNYLFQKKSDTYALCLSEKKDNLTHWDRYADGCKGVCIGFNVKAFNYYSKKMKNEVIGNSLVSYGKILYDDKSRRNELLDKILDYHKILIIEKIKSNFNVEEYIMNNGIFMLYTIFVSMKNVVKNKSFIDEDEVRVYHDEEILEYFNKVLNVIKDDNNEFNWDVIKNNTKKMISEYNLELKNFYDSKNGIRSFINLSLEMLWDGNIITEIVLGPLCIQKYKELRKFLDYNGLEKVKILKSKVPFR